MKIKILIFLKKKNASSFLCETSLSLRILGKNVDRILDHPYLLDSFVDWPNPILILITKKGSKFHAVYAANGFRLIYFLNFIKKKDKHSGNRRILVN
ncbi:hypothetical protein BpHYR1_032433 [Brachionus plicatilis]|uniref:Uncharacterized protein n=1 Tax=Brachionus plicatilis TaxID=10195 RepID=A0A3M7PDR6_BRAPC|nr:hypothetical protein BpHYR1_032433 [Brachionus plicatilis]